MPPSFLFWRKALLAALATAACVSLFIVSGLVSSADARFYDALTARTAGIADERIVVVAIDEKSLSALGRWPWRRGVHAQLLERLQRAPPKGIAFDVMFSERFAADAAGDLALARAVAASGRVVLPVMVAPLEPTGMPVEILPLPELVKSTAGLGHAAVDIDRDGITRNAYLHAGLGEAHWPALALALLASNAGIDPTRIPGERDHSSRIGSPYLWRQDHRVLVPYAAPREFQQVSYIDVLRGTVPPALLRDRWLLVGVTANGLGESVLTPLPVGEERMPGVLYQANLLNMLLRGNAITQMPVAWQILLSTVLLLAPMLLVLRYPSRRAWWFAAGGALLILATSGMLLRFAALWFPPMAALSALLIALLLLGFYRMRHSHQLAHSDALTRLANRRLFDLILRREFLAARRSGKPLSLLLIDVDHFKHYNDSCGHQAGDAMLRKVAKSVARRVSRPRDLAARYGGDELAAILPETDAAAATAIADAIVREIAGLAMPHPGAAGQPIVTVSIGVAAGDPLHETESSLLERTDIALYKAKKLGRNRSYTAPEWHA